MLSVRIDGREVETTPDSLARLVFDGEVDRHSPSRTPGATTDRSLEECLESLHYEALSDELLRRLWAMYTSPSQAGGPKGSEGGGPTGDAGLSVDVERLCERVERLSQWQWPSDRVAARFLWTAAWLNDLVGRLENAVGFYDAFLQASSHEGHLRLLAYNNRGVLRIRLGRLEGVRDLARAAIPESAAAGTDFTSGDSPPAGLPAACFNLLNLINVALGAEHLVPGVDEELTDFFRRIPEALQTLWLGGDVPADESPQGESTGAGDSGTRLAILRDPTRRRLNRFTARLALQARGLTGGEPAASPGSSYTRSGIRDLLSAGVSRLALWECRCAGEDPAGDGRGVDTGDGDGVQQGYAYCAEAATLLLSEDVPSSLTRLESPLVRAEQSVREELARIQSHLTSNRYALAKSRLQVQRRVLSSLDRRGRLADLLACVDAQLERVACLESQKEQLDLQRTCAGLIGDVDRFCKLTDLCRARREHESLMGRLRQVRSNALATSREAVVLLDELTDRLNHHQHRLNRLEVRRGIRSPLRHLRRNWPTDWAAPVPESVYRALAQCRLGDPQGAVEDWPALRERLDTHQGQYHVHKALAVLRGRVDRAPKRDFSRLGSRLAPPNPLGPGIDGASPTPQLQTLWESVEEDFTKALLFKPDLWLTVAPVLGLVYAPSADTAGWEWGSDTSCSIFGDPGPTHYAGRLLERVLEKMAGQTTKCVQLWQGVTATLSPVLENGNLDAIAGIRTLADRCLDHWPVPAAQPLGRMDPRNPVSLFLDSCEKARRLCEAGQWLDARPPQWQQAKACYAEVLSLGLDTCAQLRKAATGFYLAAYHEEDAPNVQRQVLTGLETWANAMSQEQLQQVRESDLMGEIGRLRNKLQG